MRRPWILAALMLLGAGACTATPITLPQNEDGGPWTARDAGSSDGAATDLMPPEGDIYLQPDLGWTADASAVDGAVLDALSDGVCFECPQPDGMTDGGAGDAEAGPTSDALTDLPGGDLATGD